MIRKKVIALLVATGLTASMGMSAGAYSKILRNNAEVKSIQCQRLDKQLRVNCKENIKTKLDTLVKAGTITQGVEDNVIKYFKQRSTERKAEKNKVRAMTDLERETYFTSKVKVEKQDRIANLIKECKLTPAQAEAIRKVFPRHEMGHGRKDRH